MSRYSTLEEINGILRNSQDIMSLQMGTLRDCLGYDKIGNNVKVHIENELRRFGIGFTPKNLPSYQHEWVILYVLGSPVAKLIEAVDTPNASSSDFIRETFNAKLKLDKIIDVVESK